ncbi:NUDIX domain-containing protein [Streptomyces sp. NPDC088124]|uniref:NUDIX domain-containing protein n=1 Tax=Streptomyces sp. NPDC088124 TaxID=3154654 RepID=UPI0034430E15
MTGPDGSPPTTVLGPRATLGTAAHDLEDVLGLGHGGTHLAVTDTTGEGGVHHVAWRGLLPASWTPPGAWRPVPFGRALAALESAARARLRAAARTGLLGASAAHLTDGLRPGARPAKSERTAARFTWHARTPTAAEEPTVRQVWGWLTDPYGRVLVILDDNDSPGLPGGQPEPGENRDATLAREAMEEAAARHGRPTVLGFQRVTEPGQAPYLQLRMHAPLLALGPAVPDPDNGEIYRRVLVPAAQANLLLGWGPEGDSQATAVAANVPRTHGCALQHVPEQGWVPKIAERPGRVS